MSSIKLKGSSSGEAIITTSSDGSTVNVDKNLVLPAGQNFCIGATDDVVIGRATDDRMTFNTGGTERGRFDENGNFYFNSGIGSVQIAYGVRAWVNFDGTNMGIRASGNVSSISDRGTGKFTVNLSVAAPDDDGAVLVTSSNSSTASSGEKTNATGVQNSTSALYINLRDSSNNSQKDSNYVHVAYLR
tara:strand:- start:173 stop:736 length:564 start_codon:yes stop_codon:yes gene_type:complete